MMRPINPYARTSRPTTSSSSHHRAGPNPAYIEASFHWFDGSGFVHAVALDPATQTANYSAQFVETSILKVRRRRPRTD